MDPIIIAFFVLLITLTNEKIQQNTYDYSVANCETGVSGMEASIDGSHIVLELIQNCFVGKVIRNTLEKPHQAQNEHNYSCEINYLKFVTSCEDVVFFKKQLYMQKE